MSEDKASNRFLGYLMMAAGAIIALTCGGCTLAFVLAIGSGSGNRSGGEGLGMEFMGMAYLVGAPSTLAGILLFLSGLKRAGLIERKERWPWEGS